MNLLSLFAIALIPFGVVSGLFGMNIQVFETLIKCLGSISKI
jgi:Mg2+ and Co2+ transporter CorA